MTRRDVPQHRTEPGTNNPHENQRDAATAIASKATSYNGGARRSLVLPVPRQPSEPSPQHLTPPVPPIAAHVWYLPALMDVTLDRLSTFTGEWRSTTVLSPN